MKHGKRDVKVYFKQLNTNLEKIPEKFTVNGKNILEKIK